MTAIAVSSVHAEDVAQPVIVNVENFVRAETSAQFDRILQMTGGINHFVHLRGPTPLDKQNVIRMNRDTLYSKEDVDPDRHLLGTAWGWGGLPEEEAYYLNVEPNLPVGAYQLTVKDVPVDAFWSISMYNKDGYFEANEEDAYSVNNLTGTPNEDGSFTIHFGGDPESLNHLPITEGWNYTVRFYQPRKEILEGKWNFPGVKPVK